MLTNAQMKQDRYGQWCRSRKLYKQIQDTFAADGTVTIATYAKATHYDKRHANMFKSLKDGVYVQRGKGWDFISLCGFRFTVWGK